MNIVLATEGTYPFHHGGVTVWCDQLINGLSEHQFHVMAITSTGAERPLNTLPGNVKRLVQVPLWGHLPPARPAGKRATMRFQHVHQNFVRAVVEPDRPTAVAEFLNALQGMFEYAQEANLSAALLSNDALERLSAAWQEVSRKNDTPRLSQIPFTFADALAASDLFEHYLRPLSSAPPPADIYHAVSNGLAALIGMMGKWVYGVPFVLTEHGVYLRERYLSAFATPGTYPVKTLLLNFLRLLSSAAYLAADVIQPGSNYNQRWELRNGADPRRIRTVYNGIDLQEFPAAHDEPEVPTLTWLGRIDPIKDLHTLIRAFALVHAELPAAQLRLFGAAPKGNEAYLSSCHTLVKELRLGGNAHFEGRVGHPAEAYRAGNVVLLTSISEGFPYTLIEAMATGRATVSTNVGGVAEAVADTGFVVPPRDERAIADAALTLLQDPLLRQRLGQAARQRVMTQFTLQQSLSAYRETYSTLTSHKPVRQPASPRRYPLPAIRWRVT
jgi:polysaccharide biosynthesis protein PelF